MRPRGFAAVTLKERDSLQHVIQSHMYIGVDLHKTRHTAVLLDAWNTKLGEITFANTSAAFPAVLAKVDRYLKPGVTAVYGLEDTGGYGWAFGLFLVRHGQQVKSVNPAFVSAKRQGYATVHKNDSWDAECVARVLRDDLHRLPDFTPNEQLWVLRQLVTRRRGVSRSLSALMLQLHVQLGYLYPSYRRYFSEVDGKTALAFWRAFPSPRQLEGVSAEQLAVYLRKHSHNACSVKKAEKILRCVREDDTPCTHYADDRELIVAGQARQARYYKRELALLDERMRDMLTELGCRLDSMPGIDVVTAAELAAEIGDIARFPSADKLARYAGIAPIFAGSGGKGRHYKSKQGDRSLYDIFKGLAIRQIGLIRNTHEPKNPAFRAYYERKLSEGKTKKQAIICIMRRLVNIVYGILKHGHDYRLPERE